MISENDFINIKRIASQELIKLYKVNITDSIEYIEMNENDNYNPIRLFIEDELEKCDIINENDKYYTLTYIDNLIMNLIEKKTL